MNTQELSEEQRIEYGAEWYSHIMHHPAPPQNCTYYRDGIHKFVFAEMWSRPGLDRRARRWITLACVGAAGELLPIQTHVYAALKSGDVTFEEINEFVLHFAVYMGWPKASIVQQIVHEMWEKVQEEGGTESLPVPQYPQSTQNEGSLT